MLKYFFKHICLETIILFNALATNSRENYCTVKRLNIILGKQRGQINIINALL